ncbi:hypothetical protein GCM10010329_48470 [Streptomyces spiroverticillatus]|uniref:Uncharacterized protein n=1 Tax=Streptomyces finlayi TaxID=67296 RepID=A0A919CBZ6_9ACTN|nr:hypothetical protein [Streptomyces finlayi]GHA19759.1 hypothetical protein GCM10010329_48470 [Streptomyces spiroverticillatus]GHD02632.1 hypothetical protein GCM10010334_49420 [Streptomyces finlayi]
MNDALLSQAVKAVSRARRTAGRVRRRVERINTVPALGARVGSRPTLPPVHLSLLSGRTLNLAVRCPSASTPPEHARLVFEHRGRRQSVTLAQEKHPEGLLLTATVSLRHAELDAPEATGPRLSDGVWRLTVVTTDRTGNESRYGIADPTATAPEGPTLPHSPSTTSGALFRPVRSVDGHAMIKVSGPREQAELLGFDLYWDRVTVQGRLLTTAAPHTAWTVEAVRRGSSSATVRVTPVWDGDRFTFDVPLDAMARGAKGARVWDFQLQRGRSKARLGRRLTDVRHPKKVLRTPFRTIATPAGALLRVHAHLSPAGTFAVNCAPLPNPAKDTPPNPAATTTATAKTPTTATPTPEDSAR